jgi:hypothetical protein
MVRQDQSPRPVSAKDAETRTGHPLAANRFHRSFVGSSRLAPRTPLPQDDRNCVEPQRSITLAPRSKDNRIRDNLQRTLPASRTFLNVLSNKRNDRQKAKS